MTRRRTPLLVVLGVGIALALPTAPAQAMRTTDGARVACFEPQSVGAGARGGDRTRGADHRDVSLKEQRAIERRTKAILDRKGYSGNKPGSSTTTVPTYVHVMAAADGSGNVTDQQIADQIAVLNATFGGAESRNAATRGSCSSSPARTGSTTTPGTATAPAASTARRLAKAAPTR